jgi:YgiT-type zinc finger domain-containing protein
MTKLKCPKCHKGDLVRNTIESFDTKLGGIPFTIHNAKAWQCAECGYVVATAKDLKNWRDAQRAYLQARGFVPGPDVVRKFRQSAGLSVADLATLLAVTRQTVHAWERDGLNALQAGPAAIILRLLVKEFSYGAVSGLLKALAEEAQARGQAVPTLSRLVGNESNSQGPTSHLAHAPTADSREDRGDPAVRNPGSLLNSPKQAEVDQLIRNTGTVWQNGQQSGRAA